MVRIFCSNYSELYLKYLYKSLWCASVSVCVCSCEMRCWVFSSLCLSSLLAFGELLFPSINHWANLFSHGPADRAGLLLQYWCSRSPLRAQALLYLSLTSLQDTDDWSRLVIQCGEEQQRLQSLTDSRPLGSGLPCQTHGWLWCDGQASSIHSVGWL